MKRAYLGMVVYGRLCMYIGHLLDMCCALGRPATEIKHVWQGARSKAATMARTVRDANLQTREARGRLLARGKPYFRLMEEGLHIG
jgi:hypothetical protein